MPTIKDIAREAGVSHGTVSNVINGRGNVSVEKIQLVWQAAEKLGYKVNSKAQSLRQGQDRSIAVLLPSIEDRRWAAMYEVFQNEFIRHGYSVQLYSTRSMETAEKELLAAALAERVSAVISRSCLLDAAAYYRAEAPELQLYSFLGKAVHSKMLCMPRSIPSEWEQTSPGICGGKDCGGSVFLQSLPHFRIPRCF
ncbi:MAG: LacI family DNA-binding transcriptional regulator [Dysosmobacter sp.]